MTKVFILQLETRDFKKVSAIHLESFTQQAFPDAKATLAQSFAGGTLSITFESLEADFASGLRKIAHQMWALEGGPGEIELIIRDKQEFLSDWQEKNSLDDDDPGTSILLDEVEYNKFVTLQA